MATDLRNSIGGWWLNALFWLSGHAPAVPRLLRPLVMFFTWNCSPVVRTGTLANAARILGPTSTAHARRRNARRVVGSFYDAVVDMGVNARRTPAQILARLESMHGEEHYIAARALKKGAVLATAHLGSFETAITMLAQREPRVHVVFRRDQFPLFERLRTAQRARAGVVEAPSDDGVAGWARLRDALWADEVVLLQADRVMPGQRGTRVPFLHGHLELPPGPIKLARVAGAPVIPVFAVRMPDGRVRVCVEEPIWPGEPPPPGATIDPAQTQLAAVLERYVREYADQWLCLHPAWCEDAPTTTPGATP